MQSGVKGTNLFEYCDNNVVNKADPTGHWGVPTVVDYAKKMGKKFLNWLIGRVKARIKKLVNKIIKQGKKKLKNKWEKAKKQVIKLGKPVKMYISKAIEKVYKSSKKILGNTYKNFATFLMV